MMRIGGVAAAELANAYGTPLLALDYDVLDEAIARFTSACAPYGIEIAYAAKALLLVKLAQHLKHTPLQLDVCSLGELATAESAHFPAERITMHGCGKTAEELAAAAGGRVGRIVVDGIDELRRLQTAGSPARPLQAVLRLNTGIEAHTHAMVRTAGTRTKFGLAPAELPEALAMLSRAPNLRFIGLHSHIGSQIYDLDPFVANAAALMESAAVCARSGLPANLIIAGGGFGVPMHPEAVESLDVAATARALAETVREQSKRLHIVEPRIGIEPGRALIAAAGTSLYTVVAVKNAFERPYAIVDGGIYENPRPALYDAYHHILTASREGGETIETAVCGRTCENDELGVAQLPRDLRAGELVAMCTTGAYTYSMASNYNRLPRPAVVAVRQGTHALIARREETDDLLEADCDA